MFGRKTKEKGQEVSLRFNPRAYYELGLVYRNPKEFLRELIQNAIDAGASKIKFRIDPSKETLVFEHDGEPIEGEYLDAFLEVGTDYKAKKKGKYIGMYGIGRLSWILVGDKAVIETGRNRIIWDASQLDKVVIEPMRKYVDGVRWIIHVRPDKMPEIYPEDVMSYIEKTYYGDVPIYVNGRKVPKKKPGNLIYEDTKNKVWYNPELWNGVIVKGIFAVGEDWYLRGLVVKTDDDRVKINPARGIIEDREYEEWRRELSRNILKTLKMGLDLPSITSSFDLTILRRLAMNLPYPEDIAYYIFNTTNGHIWGDEIIKNPKKFLWTENPLTDSSLIALSKKGYTVVYVDDLKIKWDLQRLGVKNAEEVSLVEETKILEDKEIVNVLEDIFNEINDAMKNEKLLEDVLEEIEEEKRRKEMRGEEERQTASITTKEGEKKGVVEVDKRTGDIKIELPDPRTGKIVNVLRAEYIGTIPHTNIVLVEVKNKDVVAFTNGEKIFVNVNNPRVKEMLNLTKKYANNKYKVLLVWAPVIIHEKCHMLGLDHTSPYWHALYEKILYKVIKRALRNL